MQEEKSKNINRVVITLNDEEYNNFTQVKEIEGKTFQMLGYLAFKKYNLINKKKMQKIERDIQN